MSSAQRTAPPAHLDHTLAALADPARRAAVELLRRQPLRSSDLAQALHLRPPAMSRHLRVLRTAGLVHEDSPESDARVRIYRLQPERFTELQGWLEEVTAFWQEQLGAFKAHVERRVPRERS